MSEIRKIAAILAADVVGYRQLAGADADRSSQPSPYIMGAQSSAPATGSSSNSAAWSTPRAGSCPHARPDFYTRLRGQGVKDNVSANALQIFQPYSNWEATCVTVFEQYWRLRYRFG